MRALEHSSQISYVVVFGISNIAKRSAGVIPVTRHSPTIFIAEYAHD